MGKSQPKSLDEPKTGVDVMENRKISDLAENRILIAQLCSL
jgi:ABC-type Na+ transport system ATPase subunit NatA